MIRFMIRFIRDLNVTKEEAAAILAKYTEREKRGWDIIDRTMTKHESNTGNLLQDLINDYMPPSQEYIDFDNEKCEHGDTVEKCATCEQQWLEAFDLVDPNNDNENFN